MNPAIRDEITRFVQRTGDPRPLRESNPSLDRRAKIACYREIVSDLRTKGSKEDRRLTWLERATVRDLLDDIAALEAEEASA